MLGRLELALSHALRVLAQEKVKRAEGAAVCRVPRVNMWFHAVHFGRLLGSLCLCLSPLVPSPTIRFELLSASFFHLSCECIVVPVPITSTQTRPDVISLQSSILDEISRLGADLGEKCVRRSHALTLAGRGLAGTRDLSLIEERVSALEELNIGACEHDACLAEAGPRFGEANTPSLAIVSAT